MIKKYKLFKEGLLNKLKGPTDEEIWNNIKDDDLDVMKEKSLKAGYLKGYKYAVENGILNIHKQKESDFRYACEKGFYDIVKYCIENNADINIIDNESLRTAVYKNNEDIVKLLLDSGANVNSFGGYIALNLAIKHKLNNISKLLLDKLDPNINTFDILNTENPSELLKQSILIDFIPGIKKAIEEGADYKENNYSVFKYAVLHNNYKTVNYFLDNYDIKLKYKNIKIYIQDKEMDLLLKSKLK